MLFLDTVMYHSPTGWVLLPRHIGILRCVHCNMRYPASFSLRSPYHHHKALCPDSTLIGEPYSIRPRDNRNGVVSESGLANALHIANPEGSLFVPISNGRLDDADISHHLIRGNAGESTEGTTVSTLLQGFGSFVRPICIKCGQATSQGTVILPLGRVWCHACTPSRDSVISIVGTSDIESFTRSFRYRNGNLFTTSIPYDYSESISPAPTISAPSNILSADGTTTVYYFTRV